MSADHVWSGPSGEVALDEIGSDPDPGQPDRGAPALARQQPRDTRVLHQALDALSPNPDPVLDPQLGVDPPRAIGAVRGGVDRPDLLDQARVRQRPVRRRATPQS